MHRDSHIKHILAASLFMLVFNYLYAQNLAPAKPDQSGEEINLFCDRAMYSVSEQIYFSAFYTQPPQVGSSPWSTVLYAELITWNGTKLAQQKVRIKNGKADGCLTIPEDIRSGNYYIRVYTRWMRNYSPYKYCYLPLKIINPNLVEIDEGPETNEQNVQLLEIQDIMISEEIVFEGLEKSYGTRQLVEFQISILNDLLRGPYCMSVAMSQNSEQAVASNGFSGYERNDTIRHDYLPEIRGVSLSGKVIDQNTQKPLARENVTLTSTLNPFYFSNIYSDSKGEFIFAMPGYTGSHQFCIKAGDKDTTKVEFLISNDYCNQAISLPYIPFELKREEEDIVKEIILNAQLFNKYNSNPGATSIQEEYPPFYGRSQYTTYVNDYIELVDLKEFFFELVPDVYIKYKNKKAYLELINVSSLNASFPILLFDNILVSNNETLLNIPSREIEKIEVVNGGYIVGKNMYSGIISIYSNNGDLAGMDLPENARFFKYSLLSDNKYTRWDYSENRGSRKADPRNLLYWSPDLELSNDVVQTIRFFTSDAIGEYTVNLRGIGKSGDIIYGQVKFAVE